MILPNKSPVHQSAMKMSSTMSLLEDALLESPAWMLLTDFERRTIRYHVKEYAADNVSTNHLVQALTELLNNDEKVCSSVNLTRYSVSSSRQTTGSFCLLPFRLSTLFYIFFVTFFHIVNVNLGRSIAFLIFDD